MNSYMPTTSLAKSFILMLLIPMILFSFACNQSETVKTDKEETNKEQHTGTENKGEEKRSEATPGPVFH